MNQLLRCAFLLVIIFLSCGWGFFGHQQINRLAVFTLPPEMIGFYKKNILFITEASVDPDRRRYAVEEEAARHYIDLDHFGDSAVSAMPDYWDDAVEKFTEDTLQAYGVLPWHVNRVYHQLKQAFLLGDPERILRVSAELGHYIADAHVPLHTTENYDGQQTGQKGIHGFWESRLPELYAKDYNFFVGKAAYVSDPQLEIWKVVKASHAAVDSVLMFERMLAAEMKEQKYSFETKGRQTQRVYAEGYAAAYHKRLSGMVERRMRGAIRTLGNFWYSAWIDAGQPDLQKLINYKPTADQLRLRKAELAEWQEKKITTRPHE